ncbi:hypothetical protein I79_017253 [Cricetulus griseus]|uniref:Uncharacterized protein n=1 Tax=Cricetulus griseus TaxID=10029 RepID=G3I1J2_CRIGR|nr:hypothetical protein I79_017253 [Cricetulus griseus]
MARTCSRILEEEYKKDHPFPWRLQQSVFFGTCLSSLDTMLSSSQGKRGFSSK